MGRPTLDDIARRAGVSIATVDRVLNRRRRVRPATEATVLSAAKALSFRSTPQQRRRGRALAPQIALGALLQKRSNPFYRRLGAQLRSASERREDIRADLHLEFVDALAPGPIIDSMRRLGERVKAMAIVSIDHPHIADEIAVLAEREVPVVSLLSPLTAARVVAHVGVDTRRVGRIAGWGMSHCARATGEIGILIGSHRYRGHEDREAGFRSYLREHGSLFREIGSMTYLDDDAGAYGTTLELLTRWPDLAGVYVIGGGAGGALRALAENSSAGGITVVCSEMGRAVREGLISGAVDFVTSTPIREIADAAVETLVRAALEPEAVESVTLSSAIHISESV